MTATVLVLDNDAIEKVFEVGDCLQALEQAYLAQADGTAVTGPRKQTYIDLGEKDVCYCLKTMEGCLPETGYMVLRLTSDIVTEAPVGGVPRREKLPRGPGQTYCGLVMLFSIRTLAPVAILHDGFIQAYRVACTSAIATRRMAREDASDLGLLGSAGQAWAHLVAMRAVRKLQRARIYSPNPERRANFAERARRELGLDACAVQSAREAVAGADLVVAATNTNSSIIDGAWLEPGAHVVSIVSGDQKTPRRELDDETMRRAAVVVVHSKEIAGHADIGVPLQKGILKPEGIAELWEIVAGRLPGRRSESDITVFKNNIGLGLQFAAVGPRIYERARAAGIGHELPSSLFLETLKP